MHNFPFVLRSQAPGSASLPARKAQGILSLNGIDGIGVMIDPFPDLLNLDSPGLAFLGRYPFPFECLVMPVGQLLAHTGRQNAQG